MNAPDRFLTWRWEDESDEITKKLICQGDTQRANTATFILGKEDHTIGNLMRMQLLRDPGVRFAGYKIPHPLVFDVYIRVETMDSKLAPINVFESALQDLQLEIETLEREFDAAVREFESDQGY